MFFRQPDMALALGSDDEKGSAESKNKDLKAKIHHINHLSTRYANLI